jgi:hypothetical protein
MKWRTWYVLCLAVSLLGGLLLAYRYPNGPLLAWWLSAAIVFGGYLAVARSITGLAARARYLLILHSWLIPFALFSTQGSARRLTSAAHVRYEGVHLENVDSVVIASGTSGSDLVFPTVVAAQLPWRLTLRRTPLGWTFTDDIDVEVRVSEQERPKRYTVLNGIVVKNALPEVVVRDNNRQALDTLRVERHGSRIVIRSAAHGSYDLGPTNGPLRHRLRRMREQGAAIGEFGGTRIRNAPFDRFVRVRVLRADEDVNGTAPEPIRLPWLRASSRVLMTAAAPFHLEGRSGSTQIAPPIRDSAWIEIRQMGSRWRFQLIEQDRSETAGPGLSVKFARNPRPLETPLPTGASCRSGVACGLLSLQRLPMPIAHIALEGVGGFDPTRFALLGNLEESESGGGVRAILPRDTVTLAGATAVRGPVFLQVTPLAGPMTRRPGGDPTYWLRLSASRDLAGFVPLSLVVVGLLLLLWRLQRAVRQLGGVPNGTLLLGDRSLALGMSALLTLLLARLTIGARLRFFGPYLSQGLDTAMGMWVALAMVTTALLLWRAWVPNVLRAAHIVAVGPLQFRTLAGAIGTTWASARAKGLPKQAGWIVLPLLLLSVASLNAVVRGVIAGGAALTAWFTVAWVTAFAGRFHSFEHGPFEVVEFDRRPSGAPTGPGDGDRPENGFRRTVARIRQALRWLGGQVAEWQAMLLAVAWASAVWRPIVGLFAGAAWLLAAVWLRRPGRSDDGPPASGAVMVGLGAFISTALIARLRASSENGAMASFTLVILLVLVSVRVGRSLATRLEGSQSFPWLHTGVAVLAPFLVLLPVAFIDMGLLLVILVPIGVATLLVGWHRLPHPLARAFALVPTLVVLFLLTFKVLYPSVSPLHAPSMAARAAHFEGMQRLAGVRLGGALERAAARAVATRDQRAAEELLVAAQPGSGRDLLLPSIEQVWGARAYSAARWVGKGLGAAVVGGGGIAEAVSYAENSFAVYVLHEHGLVGGFVVLLAYFLFAVALLVAVTRGGPTTDSLRASRALVTVAGLIVTIPAAYVALANVGTLPITGQNMPFLGLNAWSDVTLCAGVIGILITGAIRIETGRV